MELPAAGDVFIDRFELLDVLGRGGFACVFRAHDRQVGRVVALKVLAPDDGEYSKRSGARFVREARVLATLQHPSSMSLLDFGQADNGLYWLASEFVHGEDLSRSLTRHGRLAPDVVMYLMQQVLGALSEAHGRSVVHRDIKPPNLLVYAYDGDPWRVKLLDFGLAKPVNVDATRITAEGSVIGTPRYMSPEQILGLELGPASDIYSFGLVAYEMLTGTPAIAGETLKELAREQLKGQRILLPDGAAPPALCRIVERMVARQISDRYDSVAPIQRALRAVGAPDQSQDPARTPSVQASPTVQEANPSPQPETVGRGALLFLVFGVLLGAGGVLALTTMQMPAEDIETTRPPTAVVAPTRPAAPREVPPRSVDAGELAPDATIDGCGKQVWDLGLHLFRSEGARVTRFVPEDYDPNQRYPLILVAHGGDEDAHEFIKMSGLMEVAAEHRVIVLAPQASESDRKPPRSERSRFFTGILDFERRGLCVDPDRIYVVGQHHGALDAVALGCEPWVRAIAFHAHSRPRFKVPECLNGRLPPTLALWPLRSPQYPSRAGEGGRCSQTQVVPLQKLEASMRKSWACSADAKREWTEDDGRCAEWGCETPLWSCQLEGGIPWPGTAGRQIASAFNLGLANRFRDCDGPSSTFPAAQTVWDFFASVEIGP